VSRAEEFVEYGDWASEQSRLYERLSHRVATDDRLLALTEAIPDTQPAPNALFGAVHDLLLAGADGALADFYGTVTDDPADPDERDPFPAFRAFCLANEGAIRNRLTSRLVQTNAVGRSALLYPAFARIVEEDGGPLALVELGSSAGLNLLFDRYRYEYAGAPDGEAGDDATEGTRVVGDPDSPVRITSDVREGAPPVPERPPAVASRVGVDLNPVDPTDHEARRWLRALVVPNDRERHERLAPALEMAAADPPRIVEGDAVERVPDLIAEAPADATLVVYSTLVLYQLPDEAVDRLRATRAAASEGRPVHWLSCDPEVAVTDPTYRHVRFAGGEARDHRLARFDAYGSWLRWSAD
jgi:hypothetical protein